MKVRGEPPGREAYVDFVGRCENHIPEREPWPAHSLHGFGDAPTEGREQRRKAMLFFGLGGVVGGPILLKGGLDSFGYGFRYGGFAVWGNLFFEGVFDGVDVLALHAPDLMIGTGAARGITIQGNAVAASTGLGWYDPSPTVTAYLGGVS